MKYFKLTKIFRKFYSGKPISISLSPNVTKSDLHLALNLIIRPQLWKKGRAVEELENSFKNYLGIKHAISFNSGRSSLFAILKSLELEEESDVLLQAFTCNAVPNPVLWTKLNPVYVDCNKEDYNMSFDDLKAKITEKTKVVILQHTFGLPANIDPIRALCEAKNIILIEDCAHALGAEFVSESSSGMLANKVGTFGKASFFSFSRDKVISSVYGGMVATNDDELAQKIRQLQEEFGLPSRYWIIQQIVHPILLGYIILPIYNFLDLGKIFLVLFQYLNFLSKSVSKKEKKGQKPIYFPKSLPNALAIMAINQLKEIDNFNIHRNKVANYYAEGLKDTTFELPVNFENRKNIFLRYAIKHPKAHDIIYDAWHNQNILLGDWYTTPIAPFDTKIEEMRYKKGSCKNAEDLAKTTLNLPTHINIKKEDAERIINFLKNYIATPFEIR